MGRLMNNESGTKRETSVVNLRTALFHPKLLPESEFQSCYFLAN